MSESFPKDHLESLWAPWRVEYYQAEHRPDFLTEAANTTDDAAHLVVTRKKATFLIMNKYPYSSGHLMAVSYRKVSSMEELLEDEVLELWQLCIHAQKLLKECVRAQGFNVGWNLGKASGAGVADHLHLHIVPRWVGDSNFMTVTGGVRIIPEGLRPLYDRLIAAQAALG
ncbi:HIT domain-containing protein [soil metagenome]